MYDNIICLENSSSCSSLSKSKKCFILEAVNPNADTGLLRGIRARFDTYKRLLWMGILMPLAQSL